MISIIITAYGEPKATERAVNAFLNQEIKEDYEIIVADPFKEVQQHITKKFKDFKQVKYFLDPGKGKSYALNLLFKELFKNDKSHTLVLTDGDVFVNNISVEEILKKFKDPKVGCVSGRPTSLNPKNNLFGYWSHLLADAGAHKIREERDKKNKFLECSGYLFAFRNGLIREIPLDVAEDSIIPYIFWKNDYKIKYAEKALVYVRNPITFKDWLKQRKRTADAHTKLTKYYPNFPKVKSFYNEAKKGFFWALAYPKNIKEFYWTIVLFFARFYMWISLFKDLKFRKKGYKDGWERVSSTRSLD